MEDKQQVPCSLQLIVQEGDTGEGVRRGRRGSGASAVNNFIQKTFDILQEKKFESIVGWSEGESRAGGCSFKIHNVKAFEEIVLPQYFKHSNMSSFVRQVPFPRCSSTCTTSTKCVGTKTSLNLNISVL